MGPKPFGTGAHNAKVKEVADKVKDGKVVAGGQKLPERAIPTKGGFKETRRPDMTWTSLEPQATCCWDVDLTGYVQPGIPNTTQVGAGAAKSEPSPVRVSAPVPGSIRNTARLPLFWLAAIRNAPGEKGCVLHPA